MAGVRGDFGKLQKLITSLQGTANGTFGRKLAVNLAAEAGRLIVNEFQRSVDPYGVAWRPLASARSRNAKSGDRGHPLLDTARLRNSFTARATVKGFVVGTNVKYAGIHNFGGVVTTKTRVNAHSKRGRFVSKSKQSKGAKLSRISVSHAHSFRIPKRQIIPHGSIGKIWARALHRVTSSLMKKQFGR